jgi:GH35 family endo-1,4-beta-xylanase
MYKTNVGYPGKVCKRKFLTVEKKGKFFPSFQAFSFPNPAWGYSWFHIWVQRSFGSVRIRFIINVKQIAAEMQRREALEKLSALGLGMPVLGSCRRKPISGQEWSMPVSVPYRRSEADEALLVQARANINRIRKGQLIVELKGPEGLLESGLFEIRLLRHRFRFGHTLDIAPVASDMEPDFGEWLSRMGSYTAKCYWDERWHQPIEKEEGKRIYTRFEKEIENALSWGWDVKGHPLIWTVPKALPDWLDKYSPDQRLQRLLAHAGDLVDRYKDKVKSWDVCNEFLWEPSLRHMEERKWPHLEPVSEILTYLEPGIRHIRQRDPAARLILNEYGLEKDFAPGVTALDQRNRFLDLVAEMEKRGCPPDILGTQCHVREPFSMVEIQACLDHLAKSGLPVHITEFWARTPDKADSQATLQYIHDAYTLAFGHPSVENLTYWGDQGLTEKKNKFGPQGRALHQLLCREWDTQARIPGKGASGPMEAFFGQYGLFKDNKKIEDFSFSPEDHGKPMSLTLS